MSILDTFLHRFGYAKAAPPQPVPMLMAEGQRWNVPEYATVSQQEDLYRVLSWMQIAVSHVAEQAAGIEFSVKQMMGEETEDIPNHPFELLLHRPNELQSRFEFLVALFSYYKLTGNSYIWLNRPTGGEPAELWPIPPHMIRPIPDGKMFIAGYEYMPGTDAPIRLPAEDICHIRRFNPKSPFLGLSPIESLAIASAGDLAMQKYNANFFGKENAKVPGALAFADPVPDPDWAVLKSDIKQQWGGVNRSGPLLLRSVGAGGVQYLQIGLSQEDMQFLEGRKFTKEEIFAHIAPGLSSVLDVNATEANAKSGRATLMEYSVWPALVTVAEKITSSILPLYGEELLGEFDDPRITDRQLEISEQAAYERTHTVDEVRAEFYEDEEVGDERGQLFPVEIGKAAAPEPVFPGFSSSSATPTPTAPTSPFGQETPETADIMRWQRKCLKAVSRGKPASSVQFVSDAIPAEKYARIARTLREAMTYEAVKAAFVLEVENTDPILVLAAKLSEAIETARELAA